MRALLHLIVVPIERDIRVSALGGVVHVCGRFGGIVAIVHPSVVRRYQRAQTMPPSMRKRHAHSPVHSILLPVWLYSHGREAASRGDYGAINDGRLCGNVHVT